MTAVATRPLLRPSPLEAAADPLAGRYVLKERLGRGSGAEVFRAVDLHGGPDVAVKVAAASGRKQHQRIRNEAAVLARLDHPSIVKLVAQGVVAGPGAHSSRPYLIEELALGASLAETIRVGSPKAGAVALWARGLFGALAYLHANGLVHRDIKPANLMLSGLRRSPVRIIDLGIAAAIGSAPEPGISSGTVHYMSPEQASGGAVAPSWDVYAMGLVLLEVLTGQKAFPGTAIESLVARTLRSPDVPGHLGDWVPFLRSLTAMDPRDRPTAADAAAMAARLIPGVPSGSPGIQGSHTRRGTMGARPCPAAGAFPSRRHRQQA